MRNSYIDGSDLMIFTKNASGDYVAIAGSTSHSLSTSLSLTDTSVKTKDDGRGGAWTEQEADKFSWSVSASAVMSFNPPTGSSFADLFDIYKKGEPIYIVMGMKDTTTSQDEYEVGEDGSAPEGGWQEDANTASGGTKVPKQNPHLSGVGIISNLSITAEVGSKVTYDVEITGNGELSYVAPSA